MKEIDINSTIYILDHTSETIGSFSFVLIPVTITIFIFALTILGEVIDRSKKDKKKVRLKRLSELKSKVLYESFRAVDDERTEDNSYEQDFNQEEKEEINKLKEHSNKLKEVIRSLEKELDNIDNYYNCLTLKYCVFIPVLFFLFSLILSDIIYYIFESNNLKIFILTVSFASLSFGLKKVLKSLIVLEKEAIIK
jgi:hypothetical protein